MGKVEAEAAEMVEPGMVEGAEVMVEGAKEMAEMEGRAHYCEARVAVATGEEMGCLGVGG